MTADIPSHKTCALYNGEGVSCLVLGIFKYFYFFLFNNAYTFLPQTSSN